MASVVKYADDQPFALWRSCCRQPRDLVYLHLFSTFSLLQVGGILDSFVAPLPLWPQWPASLIQAIPWFPKNITNGDTFILVCTSILGLAYECDHLRSLPRDPRLSYSFPYVSSDWIYFRQRKRELWHMARRLRCHSLVVWPWESHSSFPWSQFSHLYNGVF